jgi:hypothetical protein
MRRFITLFLFTSLLMPNLSFAQQMDAKLNAVKRSLVSIETKLKTIKTGDNDQYNRISKELTKVSTLLQTTESKTHSDYIVSIQKWSQLQQAMAITAEQWQSQTASATASASANTTSTEINNQPTPTQPSANVDPDAILAKYQKQNRPPLGNYPNPSEVGEWAQKMRNLMTTELQTDLAQLQQPGVNPQDAERVKRWISGEFQQQIQQDVRARLEGFSNLTNTAEQLAVQIENINPEDNMRAYNFAHGSNGGNNAQTLQNGLVAIANAQAIEAVFPKIAEPKRQQQMAKIAIAQQKLNELTVLSKQPEAELVALPKKQQIKSKTFLKGIAQELWYRGSILAYLDKKGSIYMNSRDVGDVTNNGSIWVGSNDLGSVERNGKVWFRGNHIGTLEDNGKVWRNGTQVGLVETNGKVWIDGNSNGEIVPFEGEWKRAAVVYFFRDLFVE